VERTFDHRGFVPRFRHGSHLASGISGTHDTFAAFALLTLIFLLAVNVISRLEGRLWITWGPRLSLV
jgi:hypothetical protein